MGKRIGLIGYGGRMQGVVGRLLKEDPSCEIAGIVEIRKQQLSKDRPELAGARWFDTPEQMIAEADLDGVMIGTRCSLHTEMALKVLPSGLPLFLEKPVATTFDDLYRLKQGYEASTSPVVVSFPLRVTSLVNMVKEIVDSGKIGTIEHAQAINNVPYGGVYFHYWYRDENETGGLFLQKATHDFDYINHIIGYKPVSVCAMMSKQLFKGDKPAGLKCVDCEENRTCAESATRPDAPPEWEYCSFAEDTGNEDSGSALVRYETGMHMSYSQNFFVRRGAGARGARFMGYKGTVEFDFYTSEVKVYMHHTPRVETYRIEAGDDHFGGDTALVRSFSELVSGGRTSVSPLDAGLDSALLCLKAKQSALTGTFQELTWNA